METIFESLTVSNIKNLIGKTVEFKAPSDKSNYPYSGICKIKSVDLSKPRPIVTELVSGDDLQYAFVEKYATSSNIKPFAYSDSDRYVTFRIVE